MSIRTTATSRAMVLGSKESALECLRRSSPKAQYTATAEGIVKVNTYSVANTYTNLNLTGLYIACIISLQMVILNPSQPHKFRSSSRTGAEKISYILE